MTMSLEESIDTFLDAQIQCATCVNQDQIKNAVKIIINARDMNKKIFTMGNGGSGSTASHFASDLLKTAIIKDAKRFQVISLVDNLPVILAWSNDLSFDEIFAQQLENHVSEGDIVIGFSGSGNSKNILKGFELANKKGAVCLGFSGKSGGLMKKMCNECVCVSSTDMLTIESQHLLLCHCIINAIRNTGMPIFTYE